MSNNTENIADCTGATYTVPSIETHYKIFKVGQDLQGRTDDRVSKLFFR